MSVFVDKPIYPHRHQLVMSVGQHVAHLHAPEQQVTVCVTDQVEEASGPAKWFNWGEHPACRVISYRVQEQLGNAVGDLAIKGKCNG